MVPRGWSEQQHPCNCDAKGVIELDASSGPQRAPGQYSSYAQPGSYYCNLRRSRASVERFDSLLQCAGVKKLGPKPHERGVEPGRPELLKLRQDIVDVVSIRID